LNLEEGSFQEYKMETKNENINRQTAYIVTIKDIINSTYIKTEGEWTPNFVKLGNLEISRVNIMGVVISVSEEENRSSFVLDDGTGSIQIRIFEQTNLTLEIGDMVMIIGKPREYNNEKFIVPEIIKNINNEQWLELRKKQILVLKKTLNFETTNKQESKEEVIESDSDGIFSLIKKLDKGDGVYIDEIIKENSNAEKIIQNLLNEGEIFEIKPGKIKLLE
jgi:RPA family protein